MSVDYPQRELYTHVVKDLQLWFSTRAGRRGGKVHANFVPEVFCRGQGSQGGAFHACLLLLQIFPFL